MNYILNKENEIYYEVNWSSDNAIFLQAGDNRYVITDSRYTLEAEEQVKDAVVIESSNLIKKARELILKNRVKRLVIDSKNWDYNSYINLSKVTHLINIIDFSHKKREIKSKRELDLIEMAVKEGALAFKYFTDRIEFNIDEYELSFRLKEFLTKRGRRELSFEPIVAINKNAAKPHAKLTDTILKKDDLLLVDAGIKYNRYCSDRTRTISINENINFSKKQKFKNREMQKIYDIVLEAQYRAIDAIKVGVKISTLDKIARQVIDKAGYGKYFVHSLGHGVGLDIHERPYINKNNNDYIREGMVFTIEPGIYLKDKFGVRIEDMILIDYNSNVKILSEEV